jgi:hypothetical protein
VRCTINKKINLLSVWDSAIRVGAMGFLHGYNKMAIALDACISVGLPFYCVWCWLFNIMATYKTFRVGCSHKRGEKYYKTALCYLASGSFFWRRFLFCAVGAALYFFQLTFKKSISFSIEKIMCCKCVGYKNYDKKTDCNTTRAVEAWLCVRHCPSRVCALEGGLSFPKQIKDLFFTASLFSLLEWMQFVNG